MKEVATIIPEDEFQKFLAELQEEVHIWKEKDGLGYISILCQLAKTLTLTAGTDHELTLRPDRLSRYLTWQNKVSAHMSRQARAPR